MKRLKMKNFLKIDETPKLKRNAFLAILLSLIIIVNVGSFIYFIAIILNYSKVTAAPVPLWMTIFSGVVCLGNMICALAVWFWRKWGVIGYVVLTIAAYLVTSIVSQNFTNFLGLVGSALVVILVYPSWKFMK